MKVQEHADQLAEALAGVVKAHDMGLFSLDRWIEPARFALAQWEEHKDVMGGKE